MSRRTEKVAALIQQYLGLSMYKLELPFLTTISKVEVTPDLKWAKIWLTVMPAGEANEKIILDILKKNIYDLQGDINDRFEMKIVPRVSFKIDHSEEYSAHINELLRKVEQEKHDQ